MNLNLNTDKDEEQDMTWNEMLSWGEKYGKERKEISEDILAQMFKGLKILWVLNVNGAFSVAWTAETFAAFAVLQRLETVSTNEIPDECFEDISNSSKIVGTEQVELGTKMFPILRYPSESLIIVDN